jgi:hypothetical protein
MNPETFDYVARLILLESYKLLSEGVTEVTPRDINSALSQVRAVFEGAFVSGCVDADQLSDAMTAFTAVLFVLNGLAGHDVQEGMNPETINRASRLILSELFSLLLQNKSHNEALETYNELMSDVDGLVNSNEPLSVLIYHLAVLDILRHRAASTPEYDFEQELSGEELDAFEDFTAEELEAVYYSYNEGGFR